MGGGIGNIDRAQLEAMLGLDVPAHVQYVRWITNILTQGDLGNSLRWKTSITEEILRRIPVTFEVGLLALILSQLVAIPIGVYSALRQDTVADYVGRIFAIFGIAVPGFWLATMVMVYPSIWWNWSPPVLYVPFLEDPLENLKIVIVPAVVLGMSMSGVTMRMSRTMMLEPSNTARSLHGHSVTWRTMKSIHRHRPPVCAAFQVVRASPTADRPPASPSSTSPRIVW